MMLMVVEVQNERLQILHKGVNVICQDCLSDGRMASETTFNLTLTMFDWGKSSV